MFHSVALATAVLMSCYDIQTSYDQLFASRDTRLLMEGQGYQLSARLIAASNFVLGFCFVSKHFCISIYLHNFFSSSLLLSSLHPHWIYFFSEPIYTPPSSAYVPCLPYTCEKDCYRSRGPISVRSIHTFIPSLSQFLAALYD